MSQNAVSSQGGTLKVTISGLLTAIPNIKSFEIPSPPLVFEDTSTLDDVGGFPTRLLTGKDFAEFTTSVVLDATDPVHLFLIAAYDAGAIVTCQAANSNASITRDFDAYIEVKMKLETRKAEMMDVTFKITGAVS